MKERTGQLRESTLRHIAAQRELEFAEIVNLANQLSLEGLGKGEIYRELMNGYGVPKSHISGREDGEVRVGGRNCARKKSIKRNH